MVVESDLGRVGRDDSGDGFRERGFVAGGIVDWPGDGDDELRILVWDSVRAPSAGVEVFFCGEYLVFQGIPVGRAGGKKRENVAAGGLPANGPHVPFRRKCVDDLVQDGIADGAGCQSGSHEWRIIRVFGGDDLDGQGTGVVLDVVACRIDGFFWGVLGNVERDGGVS